MTAPTEISEAEVEAALQCYLLHGAAYSNTKERLRAALLAAAAARPIVQAMTAPTDAEIEAAAKTLCYLNGIPECNDSHPDCGPPCTPQTCRHGMRDFGNIARAALLAAAAARPAQDCSVCNGRGHGQWSGRAMHYGHQEDCPHCKGTGKEPPRPAQADGWQPIETAPESYTAEIEVGFWLPCGQRWEWVSRGGRRRDQWYGENGCFPSHWRPLPAPPQQEADDEGSL